MTIVILIIHLFVAAALVGLVLVQRSEGGALGMGGGSNSLISGRGAADALARLTMVAGAIFFVTSITLTMLAGSARRSSSVIDQIPASAPLTTPAPTLPPVTAEPSADGTTQIVPSARQAVQRAGPLQPRDESQTAPNVAPPGGSAAGAPSQRPALTPSAVPARQPTLAQPAPAQLTPGRTETAPGRAAATIPSVSTVTAAPVIPPPETLEQPPIAAPAPTIPRPRAGPEE